jgi:hypothetical protein
MSAKLTLTIPVWLDRLLVWPLLLYRLWKYGFTYRRIYLGDLSGVVPNRFWFGTKSEGLFTLVDPPDYYWLNNFHWSPRQNSNCIYAVRFLNERGKKTKIVSLHRLLLNPAPHILVDHRNGDTLDNRRDNLRPATHSQNQFNKAKTTEKTSSRFIGVYLEKHSGLWGAKISRQGKSIWLGRFKSELDAAKVYDEAAKKYHGEFARLNFPQDKAGACPP